MGYKSFTRRAVTLALCAVALGLAARSAWAHDYTLGELAIGHPWAPESVGPAPTGAAYFSVVNGGAAADRLVAATTPVAKEAQLHTHLVEDGVVRMRQLKGVDVDPGNPVEFRPGGLHVMLIGLAARLKAGESFALTLTFEKAGAIEVEVRVEARRPIAPEASDHHLGH